MNENNKYKVFIDCNLQIKNKKELFITVKSNVPDNGIFVIGLMNDKLESREKIASIKDGLIIERFNIPSTWDNTYITSVIMFSFDITKYEQPKYIRDLFGENGENIIADNLKTLDNGKNYIMSNPVKIPYPNIEKVNAERDRLFSQSLQNLKLETCGYIINIEQKNNWNNINVILERRIWDYFSYIQRLKSLDEVGFLIRTLIKASKKIEENSFINITFYDNLHDKLAESLVPDGYKIMEN